MSHNGKVNIGCTHGEEAPDRVVVAYPTAVAALDQGKEVVMWLTVEGVRLALSGYTDGIRVGKDPPGERLHREFVNKGGRMYVCPICFNERALDQADFAQCAELKGATPLLEFGGNGAMTFTY